MDTGSIDISGEEIFHVGGSSNNNDFFVERSDDMITVDAVTDALDPVTEFIDEYLKKNNCSSKVRNEIRLAVEEIFINICSYAYKPDRGDIRIICTVAEDQSFITIQFSDTGIPFDPLQRETPDTTGEHFLKKAGGFGIHLVKQLMDEVTYDYKDGKNILKIKRLL